MASIDSIHPYWLIVVSLTLSMLPILVGLCSAYLKVSVVLGLLRSGLGAQQVPSGMLIMALSAALSAYIMAPVCTKTYELAQKLDLSQTRAAPQMNVLVQMAPLLEPWREFLLAHCGERELRMLSSPSGAEAAVSSEGKAVVKHDLYVVIPAFVLSEIKEAFAMGFVLLLPFLIIDLIVANVLAGMGMMMVSPAMISLPLKLLLFVAADGWLLLSRSLILSYGA
jgi:type III secretion protein R